jgi:hypothetical protein
MSDPPPDAKLFGPQNGPASPITADNHSRSASSGEFRGYQKVPHA